MAYESGYTHLDGKPCPPEVENYFWNIVMLFLVAALIVNFVMLFVSETKGYIQSDTLPYAGLAILVIGSLMSGYFVRKEYLSRKHAFAAYNHKLSVYEKRKSMVIDNGGTWKSDKERYYELFS